MPGSIWVKGFQGAIRRSERGNQLKLRQTKTLLNPFQRYLFKMESSPNGVIIKTRLKPPPTYFFNMLQLVIDKNKPFTETQVFALKQYNQFKKTARNQLIKANGARVKPLTLFLHNATTALQFAKEGIAL